jgi:hypothetical protein
VNPLAPGSQRVDGGPLSECARRPFFLFGLAPFFDPLADRIVSGGACSRQYDLRMSAWVTMPRGAEALRGAALRELDHALGAIRCAAQLVARNAPVESGVLVLALAVLDEAERGSDALRRLAG